MLPLSCVITLWFLRANSAIQGGGMAAGGGCQNHFHNMGPCYYCLIFVCALCLSQIVDVSDLFRSVDIGLIQNVLRNPQGAVKAICVPQGMVSDVFVCDY